jgi:hypothetical protein
MRRIITALVLAAAMVLATVSIAMAGGPTCENALDTGWKNHGEHVTSDYATPGVPGGAEGGPAHFGDHPLDATPGATFCDPGNNQAPELLGTPGRF